MKKILAGMVFAGAAAASSAAWALVAQPVNVPEPGMFGIVAAGAAALILVARLHHRR